MSGALPMTAVRDRVGALLSASRFGKFVSVGALGAVGDNTVLLLSAELGLAGAIAAAVGQPALAPEVAKLLGIETAIVLMFVLNDRYTFAGADGGVGRIRRLLRSNTVRVGGIVVQLVVFSAVYRGGFVALSIAGVDGWLLVASLTGIGAGMLVNYVAESILTWRVHERR